MVVRGGTTEKAKERCDVSSQSSESNYFPLPSRTTTIFTIRTKNYMCLTVNRPELVYLIRQEEKCAYNATFQQLRQLWKIGGEGENVCYS